MPLNQADIDAFFTTRAGSSSKSASSPLRAPPRATSGTQTQRTPWTIAKANTGRQANGASSTTPTRTRNTNGGNTTSSRRSNGGASLSRYAATVGTQHRRVQHTAARPQYSSEDSGESSGSDINDIKLSPTQMPVARRGRRVVSDSDEASDSEAKAGGPSNADDPDDSDDGLRLSTDGNGQGKRKAASSDGSDSAAPRRTRRRARQADPDASELEEEDNLTRPRRKPTTPRLTRSRAAKTNDSVKVEDDSDVVEVTPAPTRARKNSARRSDRRRQADPDDSEDFIVSDEEATPPRSRRKRTSTSGGGSYRRQHDTDDDDTDVFIVSDGQVTPVRSRRKSKSTPGSSARRRIVDPDEESDDSAQTEDEAPDALELDQPERFATATRLRQRRETDRQRLLRKLKNKRLNIVSSGSEEDEGNGNDGYDYANGSGDEAVDREGSGSFIADDDDDEAFDANLLPSEFSLGYAQSREYKFKVVFQYLLLLVIHGPGVLPLRGAQKEYMAPVAELRDYVRGIRNLRVRSQIWRADFVKAMETYPLFQIQWLTEKETYCNACNRRNQHCWQHVYLTGTPYDPNSHADLPHSSSSEDDDDQDEEEPLPRSFYMGRHCCDSAQLYHSLSHWEHELFLSIRGKYRELLRAKGYAASGDDSDTDADENHAPQLGGNLPDVGDVNAVLEWMESRQYQNQAYTTFARLEDKARKLGGDDAGRAEQDHS